MPHVVVKIAVGRSRQQKDLIASEITKSVMSTAKVGEDAVSVSIEDFEPGEWAEKVYRPDILDKPESLYKKPGYHLA